MSQFAERHYRSLLLAIWLIGCALLLSVSRNAIADWRMGDPDDQLRMVQVRDWLAGQSWWDITQYRMNPPFGGPMHWSRLVDVPIAAVILALAPLLGQPIAEQTAAAIVPLLTLGVVLSFFAATVRRLFGSTSALLAALLFLAILPAMAQLAPMRIDHHGWQLALFFVASWTLFDRIFPVRAALIMGLALALWIEISIEGLPFAVVFLALLGIRWLLPTDPSKERQHEWAFAAAVSALAAGSSLFYAITEGWSATPNHCDSMSPFHVGIFSMVAIVSVAGTAGSLRLWPSLPTYVKIIIGAVAGVAGLSTLFIMAPQCAGDAFAQLDPLVRRYWFNRVPEGMPLWSVQLDFAIQQIAGLLAGLIGLVYLFWFCTSLKKDNKLLLSLLFLACTLVGSFVSRTAVYAVCVGSMMLAPMVIDLFSKADNLNGLTTRMTLRVLAIMIALPTMAGQTIMNHFNAAESAANSSLAAEDKAFDKQALDCQKLSSVAALGRIPATQLMAGLDTSPSILQSTNHKVIATGHHRNQEAMADVIRTFTGSVQEAETILKQRGVKYLVTCEGSFELMIYAHSAPNGFYGQIKRGQLPTWLSPQPDIGPFHIFKVDDNADSGLALR